jgi:hypothetical protein
MISCVYRFCEKNIRNQPTHIRPSWFDKRKCLTSFLNAVEYAGTSVKEVVFVLDGPAGELYDLIPKQYTVVKLNRNENFSSSVDTLHLSKELNANINLIEDDYLHKPNSLTAIANVIDQLKFVTNYDHPAQYTNDFKHIYDHPNKNLEYFDEQTRVNWRTANYCCYTFAVNKDLFLDKNELFHANVCKAVSLCIELQKQDINLWRSDPGLIMQLDRYTALSKENWQEFNEQIQ